MKKQTIKDLLGRKPSAALRAMRDGLKKQSRNPSFEIDMTDYGSYIPEKGICCGCAATCAVIQLNPNFINILKKGKAVDNDIHTFERAIEAARTGNLDKLFYYMGVIREHKEYYDRLFYLSTEDWREQLPAVTKLAKLLARKGL